MKKKFFNRLLGDFCLYMYESLRCVFEFKPQVAYTLARKPLIDDIFYLQYLYLKPTEVLDLVFSEDSQKKDVGNNKKTDEEHSDEIAKQIDFDESFFNLRYDDAEYGILHNCNKAMHIATSRSKASITKSGELNFVFMEDDQIELYIKLYLGTVPLLLFYVAIISIKISEKINGKDNVLNKKLETLQKNYEKIMEKQK